MVRISVLMGIYNCASTLVEALDSLYAQTYQDFKIILCEDGSTDNTYEVAQQYAGKHDNIILLRNERNMGLNYTLNRCLEQADTEYVARMDGDDISLPERFEKEINFLDEHPEFVVVSCPMIYFDKDGVFRVDTMARKNPTKMNLIYGSPFCHAPCMARTAAFKAVGGYSEAKRYLRVEDYNLWAKLYAAGYKGSNLQEPLYKMRDDRSAAKRRTLRARWNSTLAKFEAYYKLGIPLKYYPKALNPLMIGLLPNWLYVYLRKRKFEKMQARRAQALAEKQKANS
ncbi:MAG: glycosyltransferase [Muribaculaceae bacterium]|nr:glycosyltransferase [Muribaculaceae bacterium]